MNGTWPLRFVEQHLTVIRKALVTRGCKDGCDETKEILLLEV